MGAELCRPRSGTGSGGVGGGHSGGDKAAAVSRGSSRRAEGRGATTVQEGRLGGRRWTGRSWGQVREGARAGLGRGTRGPRASEGPVPRGWGSKLGEPKLRRSRGGLRVTRRPRVQPDSERVPGRLGKEKGTRRGRGPGQSPGALRTVAPPRGAP